MWAFITDHAARAPIARMRPSPPCWLSFLVSSLSAPVCCCSVGCAWWGCCSCWIVSSGQGKGLWFLPPLFALWINLHGSWVFGMVVFVLTIASGLVEGEWGLVVARRWTSGELKKLLLAFAASVTALFVNPFGYKLVTYPFDLLFRQQSNMQNVAEWRSVDFGTGNGKLALIVILALLAGVLFSRRPLEAR